MSSRVAQRSLFYHGWVRTCDALEDEEMALDLENTNLKPQKNVTDRYLSNLFEVLECHHNETLMCACPQKGEPVFLPVTISSLGMVLNVIIWESSVLVYWAVQC